MVFKNQRGTKIDKQDDKENDKDKNTDKLTERLYICFIFEIQKTRAFQV